MEKRGLIIYKALLILVASAMIIAAFYSAGQAYGSQEAFYKLAVAKDLALTIDLMYGLPGDVKFTYPNDVSKYEIDIGGNTIKVYRQDLGKGDRTFGTYSFVGIGQDSINTQIKGYKFVMLEKINNHIEVKGVNSESKK